MEKILTYKMTHDTGFAPNPFHDFLTLATCKPAIRRAKKRKAGEWIAGICSKTLQALAKENGIEIEEGAIIWIGKISEILPFNDYFNYPRFKSKKPSKKSKIFRCGDNIYKIVEKEYKQCTGDLEDDDKPHQYDGAMETDLRGENVLIFEEFYYLGDKGFLIPDSIDIQINKKARTKYVPCEVSEIDKLIQHIKGENDDRTGQIGEPCLFGGGAGCGTCGTRKSKKTCG